MILYSTEHIHLSSTIQDRQSISNPNTPHPNTVLCISGKKNKLCCRTSRFNPEFEFHMCCISLGDLQFFSVCVKYRQVISASLFLLSLEPPSAPYTVLLLSFLQHASSQGEQQKYYISLFEGNVFYNELVNNQDFKKYVWPSCTFIHCLSSQLFFKLEPKTVNIFIVNLMARKSRNVCFVSTLSRLCLSSLSRQCY